ncbi:class I SAM-dependent RNA methyltransferase [Rhizobium sp. C4]|uniref:class I SAM-dependent RNA methyltransferase n=1 Tax=Rhizobium sp. C4 TaxID=1349800 RepID=UPI001E51403B|nr:class I SAM-dependent RNA methyltransferase [Rhizobium sp. C4]MCD2172948.1 class I SAM-dependent RNA methyltransferase [Rhizobium sp. C4]
MSAMTLDITRLGAEGDGVAETANGPVFVPFAHPGDRLKAAVEKSQGTIMALTEPSPDRIAPVCRHFGPDGENGACGGCSLQHVDPALYAEFKRGLVINALRSKGIDVDVGALVAAHPGERRRAVFAARKTEKELLLGFNQAGSHHIVNISECPVLKPSIVARLDDIRIVGRALAPNAEAFRMAVLETLTGLDISVEGMPKLSDQQRQAAIAIILKLRGIARVSVDGEILIEPTRPIVRFGDIEASPPAGGFTQATVEAEDAMAQLVSGIVGKAKAVADLFAGSGTFALRLAQQSKVHAVEGDAPSVAALEQAARRRQGLKPLTTERRDLFRRPMMTSELKHFDAVVFDPPRAGAEAQSKELARSTVRKIAAVSCNPLTLARDLSILVAGGYRVVSVTPIDQFLWSPHVEVVAALERPKK